MRSDQVILCRIPSYTENAQKQSVHQAVFFLRLDCLRLMGFLQSESLFSHFMPIGSLALIMHYHAESNSIFLKASSR